MGFNGMESPTRSEKVVPPRVSPYSEYNESLVARGDTSSEVPAGVFPRSRAERAAKKEHVRQRATKINRILNLFPEDFTSHIGTSFTANDIAFSDQFVDEKAVRRTLSSFPEDAEGFSESAREWANYINLFYTQYAKTPQYFPPEVLQDIKDSWGNFDMEAMVEIFINSIPEDERVEVAEVMGV